MAGEYRSAPVFRSDDPQTYQEGVPYQPPLMTADILAGNQIPRGPEIGGGEGEAAAVINVRGLGPIVIRAPSGEQLNRLREDPQTLNRYLDDRFSEFRGFVDTVYQGMSPADKAALWTSPIPLVGDAAGLFADALNYIDDPESRTLANGLLTLMSTAPLVPNKRLLDQAEQVKRNIKAWHGSPHRFDRFSMSKIGTGEGAQAYGHGLYFAEDADVARGYRNTLSGKSSGALGVSPTNQALDLDPWNIYIDGQRMGDVLNDTPQTEDLVNAFLSGDKDSLVRQYKERLDFDLSQLAERNPKDYMYDFYQQKVVETRNLIDLLEGSDDIRVGNGALYETTLNVDPDDLLDWDLPLSEQPERVRRAIQSLNVPDRDSARSLHKILQNQDSKGEYVYRGLVEEYSHLGVDVDKAHVAAARDFMNNNIDPIDGLKGAYSGANEDELMAAVIEAQGGPQAAASKRLMSAGVPGVRYLDGNSRQQREGMRNFVMFDDSLVNIDSIDGVANKANFE